MTKAELRRYQQGTLRRFVVMFMLISFALGLMIAWVMPGLVVWLLSVVVLVMAAMAFEARYRASKQLSPLGRKRAE